MVGLSLAFRYVVLAAVALVIDASSGDGSKTAATKALRLGSSSLNSTKVSPCQPPQALHTMVQVDAMALHHQVAALRADLAAKAERARAIEAENARMREELGQFSRNQLLQPVEAHLPTMMPQADPQNLQVAPMSAPPTTPAPATTTASMGAVPAWNEIPPLSANALLPSPPGMSCKCTPKYPWQYGTTPVPGGTPLPGHAFTWSGYLDHGHAKTREGKEVEDPELARALQQAMQASTTAGHIQKVLDPSSSIHEPGFLDDLKSYHTAVSNNSSNAAQTAAAVDLARAAMETPKWR